MRQPEGVVVAPLRLESRFVLTTDIALSSATSEVCAQMAKVMSLNNAKVANRNRGEVRSRIGDYRSLGYCYWGELRLAVPETLSYWFLYTSGPLRAGSAGR